MKAQILLLICCLALCNVVIGQTASITSNSEVCIGELITFESTTAGAVSKYAWDFGDGASSTQDNPSHIFSVAGAKTVKLSVTFTNGTVLTADKSIVVHDLPVPDFSLDGSSFCLNNQDVCLTDNSSMGSTTNGYDSRIILWGDGNSTTSNNPASTKQVCYGGYQSLANNPYTIIVEVINDKGCEAKWQDDINILPDFQPTFQGKIGGATCDDQEVCFTNGLANKPPSIASFEWDYGDGSTNSTNWAGECHKYTASGVYRVTLKVVLTNGCENEYSFVYPINIFKFETDVSINSDTALCFGQPLRLSNSYINGATYAWQVYDANKQYLRLSGTSNNHDVTFPCPGDYYVKLQMTVGNCTKESRFIKFSALGVMASFDVYNQKQCISLDTVYTASTTKMYPTANPSYFWNFGDAKAPDCFGYPANCNKDSNENSQHFYLDTGCMTIRLDVIDRATGCTSFVEDQVSFVNPSAAEFSRDVLKPCLGFRPDYGVTFRHKFCDGEVKVCSDSLRNDKLFEVVNVARTFGYTSVADPDGWVTVGFSMKMGEDKVYRSANPNDFYLDASRVCYDTVWFHHWFQLFPGPNADFVLTADTLCLPSKYTLEYVGGETEKLDLLIYSWDIAQLDSVAVTDTVPSIAHTYFNEGKKNVTARVVDSLGCYDVFGETIKAGYYNAILGDATICLGQELVLEDSIRYFDNNFPYWRNPSRPEKLIWDVGDGSGFVSTDPILKHTYTSRGVYFVKLASSDKDGCVDTSTIRVVVGGVNAAIEDANREYLCDQIVQFKDSSYFDFNTDGDIITKYHWDFGDFTTPSSLKDPFHYYSSNGNFILTLSVQSRDGCIDTARIPIYLKGPEPYFDIVSDTMGCAPFTAEFASFSDKTSSFVWRMGDQNQTTISAQRDTTFSFTYTQPGTYYIYLEGSDSFVNENTNNTYTCSALFPDTNAQIFPVRKIIVLPTPPVLFYVEDPLCLGDTALFINKSDSVYTQMNWEIGGEYFTSVSDFKLPLKEEGVYSVKLLPTYEVDSSYQRHCFDSFSNSFSVSGVVANFGYDSRGLCSEYFFTDSSVNAVSYSWDFGHTRSGSRNTSDIANPSHRYGTDKGDYTICLTVANEQGCIDSSCVDVSVDYVTELKLYNIFTPENDGVNDEFTFEIENYSKYELLIYNRYGELMFSSTDPQVGWNGKYMNEGENVPQGTYFYVFTYRYNCQKADKLAEGLVELLR